MMRKGTMRNNTGECKTPHAEKPLYGLYAHTSQ